MNICNFNLKPYFYYNLNIQKYLSENSKDHYLKIKSIEFVMHQNKTFFVIFLKINFLVIHILDTQLLVFLVDIILKFNLYLI